MKVGIIGAGFTGLAAAYYLAQRGIEVQVYEKDLFPGGLAVGFSEKTWAWSLEKHYHHLFESDWEIRNLAAEVGHPISFTRPITATLYKNKIYPLDSALSLLKFPYLSLWDKFRTGLTLAFLKLNPIWQPLQKLTAKKFIKICMGDKSWEVLWEPLFRGKFGEYADQISASWFWSRIYKRSPQLGYPQGGFLALAKSIEKAAVSLGAKFKYGQEISDIKKLLTKFDKVICTLPTPLFSQISGLSYPKLQGLGAVNLVLALKHKFLEDQYWLNINDRKLPFLSLVEHTNFVDKRYYANNNLIYLGNYLPANHEYFSSTTDQLLQKFLPALQKINPKFDKSWVRKAWLWKAPFAQPIVTPEYQKFIPDIQTPIPNLYLANIQQVYPWDRGTNYAVELGKQVAGYV